MAHEYHTGQLNDTNCHMVDPPVFPPTELPPDEPHIEPQPSMEDHCESSFLLGPAQEQASESPLKFPDSPLEQDQLSENPLWQDYGPDFRMMPDLDLNLAAMYPDPSYLYPNSGSKSFNASMIDPQNRIITLNVPANKLLQTSPSHFILFFRPTLDSANFYLVNPDGTYLDTSGMRYEIPNFQYYGIVL